MDPRVSLSPDGPDSTISASASSAFLPVSSATTTLEDYRPGVNDEGKSCLICGHVSHGYHFGILACRACAAFFRRTVAEKVRKIFLLNFIFIF
jgi:hypothetical protein